MQYLFFKHISHIHCSNSVIVICNQGFENGEETQCQEPVVYTTTRCECKIIVGKVCMVTWLEQSINCAVCRVALGDGQNLEWFEFFERLSALTDLVVGAMMNPEAYQPPDLLNEQIQAELNSLEQMVDLARDARTRNQEARLGALAS